MNFNIINASLVVVGAILIYCGVKDITPKQALQEIISGSGANKPVAASGSKSSAFSLQGGTSGGGGGGGGGGSW